MMVGRPVQLEIQKAPARPGETVLKVEDLHVRSPRAQEGRRPAA